MNVDQAKALLGKLAVSTNGAQIEIGTSGHPPHDYAYLRLTSPTDPGHYAVVSTPGDGWFQIEVTGGFNTGQTSDLTDDRYVREILESLVRAASAYLGGRWSTGKSMLFRVPFVIVQTEERTLKLGLSIRETFKYVFKL